MAQKYLSSDRSALFSIENDVDDDEFLRRRPASSNSSYPFSAKSEGIPAYSNSFENQSDNFEERRLQLLERKREIEERTCQSTKRSLNLLRNSEEVGIATAEELMKQREQLERTDKRLDEINQTLRFSHKHIQGIKSVFGSLKNYLSGKADSTPLPPQFTKDNSPEVNAHVRPLSQTLASCSNVSSTSNNLDHPALRIRGLSEESENSLPLNRAKPANPQAVIDEDIDEIMSSITRLKGLAHGLGEEIESQNDQLDNTLRKVDDCDIKIQRQNKDMKRILNSK